eukprot:TRINITY_DN9483_c0_g1_i1.p1 TRINITY_DN9483_c0_g1~~TRINITY_DN9483_c0_g1_i1.p1  ORF type:complete len:353 (+),score=34.89 TRINITY_DN9483_c0_g1_i1:201-1259(+)
MQHEERYIFVTGCTGFVGGHLLHRLIQLCLESSPESLYYGRRLLVNVRTTTTPLMRSTMYEHPGFLVLSIGDISDENYIRNTFKEYDIEYVFHCAASGGDWGAYDQLYKSNFLGTKYLIENSLKLKHIKRFIYISTVDVYPTSIPPRYCNESVNIFSHPSHNYTADTKIKSELLLMRAFTKYNLPITIIRPSTIYGPGSFSYVESTINLMKEGKGTLISGSNKSAGLVYIDDFIDMIILATENERSIGEIYNCSDNYHVTWKHFYNTISKKLKVPSPFINIPSCFAVFIAYFLESYQNWFSESPFITKYVLSISSVPQLYPNSKAKIDLGWQPKVSFSQGMQKTCLWLKGQR